MCYNEVYRRYHYEEITINNVNIWYFILVSCNDEPTYYSDDSNPTSENQPSTDVNTGSDKSNDTEEDKKKDESVYDDNIDWGPLH